MRARMLIDVHHPSHGATLARPDTTTITFAESSVDFPFAFFVQSRRTFFHSALWDQSVIGAEVQSARSDEIPLAHLASHTHRGTHFRTVNYRHCLYSYDLIDNEMKANAPFIHSRVGGGSPLDSGTKINAFSIISRNESNIDIFQRIVSASKMQHEIWFSQKWKVAL